MNTIIAVATEDCLTVTDNHFGDAKYYAVYEIVDSKVFFRKRIAGDELRKGYDVSRHESKAEVIINGLMAENVKFVVSGKFGTNIVYIMKELIAVKSEVPSVHETVDIILKNLEVLGLNEKSDKKYLVKLKEDSLSKIYV